MFYLRARSFGIEIYAFAFQMLSEGMRCSIKIEGMSERIILASRGGGRGGEGAREGGHMLSRETEDHN